MSTIQDFEIGHLNACKALGIQANALAGKPLVYKIMPNGSRVSWASDIVQSLRLKYPNRALAKLILAK